MKFFSKEHPLSILSVSTPMVTGSTIESDQIVLFFQDNSISLSNIPGIGMFKIYV